MKKHPVTIRFVIALLVCGSPFYCSRGSTATFMAIYDMMKNPDVKFEDIMLRHAMTGGDYLPYRNSESDIAEVYIKRAKRIRQVYDYLQEMDGNYTVPWTEWITNRETEHYDKKVLRRVFTIT